MFRDQLSVGHPHDRSNCFKFSISSLLKFHLSFMLKVRAANSQSLFIGETTLWFRIHGNEGELLFFYDCFSTFRSAARCLHQGAL